MTRGRRAAGLALLEVLVALVLLSLLVVGYLRLFQGTHRLFARSEEWSAAVAYATEAMERVKAAAVDPGADWTDGLPAGWDREVRTTAWQPGLALVTVTVTLPGGGRVELQRLRPQADR